MRRVASRGFYIPSPSESAVVRAGEAPPGATSGPLRESWLRSVYISLRWRGVVPAFGPSWRGHRTSLPTGYRKV